MRSWCVLPGQAAGCPARSALLGCSTIGQTGREYRRATNVGPFGGGRLSRTAADKSPCSAKVEAVISGVVHGVNPQFKKMCGAEKTKPPVGEPTGG